MERGSYAERMRPPPPVIVVETVYAFVNDAAPVVILA